MLFKRQMGANDSRDAALSRRRTCDQSSALELGTPEQWEAQYERGEASPGGTFKMYYAIEGDEIEVAMVAETTSWVALGWRAMRESGTEAPAAAAYAPPLLPRAVLYSTCVLQRVPCLAGVSVRRWQRRVHTPNASCSIVHTLGSCEGPGLPPAPTCIS